MGVSKKGKIRLISVVVLTSVSLTLSSFTEADSASKFSLSSIVEAHKSEILTLAKKYGVLPSTLMARYLIESHLGVSKVDLEKYVKSLYTSNKSLDKQIVASANTDEVIALMFASDGGTDSDFVGEMNALLQNSDISNLDTEAFDNKPVYSYDEGREELLHGEDFNPVVVRNVPLSTESSSSVSDVSIDNQVTFYNYLYKSNKDINKIEFKAWSWGFPSFLKLYKVKPKSDLTWGEATVSLSASAEAYAKKELSYFKIDDISVDAFRSTSSDLVSVGSSSKRALFTREGRLVGVWFKGDAEGEKELFGRFTQFCKMDGGVVMFGFRAGNLSSEVPYLAIKSSDLKAYKETEELANSGISQLKTKPVKQFYFPITYTNYFIVKEDNKVYILDSNGNQVGGSEYREGSTLWDIGGESLWLRY